MHTKMSAVHKSSVLTVKGRKKEMMGKVIFPSPNLPLMIYVQKLQI